jgi:hypothetical protein
LCAFATAEHKKGTAAGKSGLVDPAREPKGLRLCWWSYTGKELPAGVPDRQLWTWGEQRDALSQRLVERKPLCLPSGLADVLHCSFGTADAGTWYADFGDEFFEVVEAAFYKGQFFEYTIWFPEEKYEYVKQTLLNALGKPGVASNSVVSNSYGATFDKQSVVWASAKVAVLLNQRTTQADTGSLTVVYLPISEKAPKRPAVGKAPF